MTVTYKYCVSYLKPERQFTREMHFNDEAKAEAFAERKREKGCTHVTVESGNFQVEEDAL